MEGEHFHVLEWTIYNFTCWNEEIHDKLIPSPNSPYCEGITFHLFPRGICGHSEHLLVRINFIFSEFFSDSFSTIIGELSFIGSDGSLLHQQHVDSKGRKVVVLPGPKYEEVIAQIRENEDLQGDRLTLRFRVEQNSKWEVSVADMRTTIDAFYACVKITPQTLKDLSLQNHYILSLFYPTKKAGPGQKRLVASNNPIDPSKIELTLQRDFADTKELMITRMSVIHNKVVVRKEESQHLYRVDNKLWTFSNSLTSDEIANEGLTIILSIKIIPDNSYTKSFSLRLHYGETVHPIKVSQFELSATSVPEEHGSKSQFSVGSNQSNNSMAVLTKELMRLYQNRDFSDLQLKCGEYTFPVHRAILCARSPVLKALLSCDLSEAQASGCMDDEDLDPSTLARFLTFLYTGALLEDLQVDSALKLYYLADKYQVPSLKVECVSLLRSTVSISNVCVILTLAGKDQDVLLISVAHDFILEHYNEFMRSQEWKNFMTRDPYLALETVTHFAEKNLVKKS